MRRAWSSLCALALVACGPQDAGDDGKPNSDVIGKTSQEVIQGTEIDPANEKKPFIFGFWESPAGVFRRSRGSATMLTDQWVLTAAHVFEIPPGVPPPPVTCPELLGAADGTGQTWQRLCNDSMEIRLGTEQRSVEQVYFHPRWNPQKFDYSTSIDVALVKLNLPIDLIDENGSPYPANAPFRRQISTLSTQTIAGMPQFCHGYGQFECGVTPPFDHTLVPPTTPPLRYGRFAHPGFLSSTPQRYTILQEGPLNLAPGDSGGACTPTDQTAGAEDVFSVISWKEEVPCGNRTFVQSAPSFRNFVRTIMGPDAPPERPGFAGGPDSIGIRVCTTDDFIALRPCVPGNYILEVQFGGQSYVFDSTVNSGFAPVVRAFASAGDFNGDGTLDILLFVNSDVLQGPFVFLLSLDPQNIGASSLTATTITARDGEISYVNVVDNPGADDIEVVFKDGSGEVLRGTSAGFRHASSLVGFDYNNDGFEDVAVSSPGENSDYRPCIRFSNEPDILARTCLERGDLIIHRANGAVHLISGNPADNADPSTPSSSFDESALQFTPDAVNHFGEALAWGHFTGNSQFLMVGAPGTRNTNNDRQAGVVYLVDATGGTPSLAVYSPGDHPDAFVGRAVAAGDLDGDGFDEWIFSAPGPEQVYTSSACFDNPAEAGCQKYTPPAAESVFYYPGTADRAQLGSGGLQLFPADLGYAAPGVAQFPRQFGRALQAGDFNCDGRDDLAIGSPGVGVGSHSGAGSVAILYATDLAGYFDLSKPQFVDASSPDIDGDPITFGRFGQSLAAGNFNNDYVDGKPCVDLAIGRSREGSGGAVTVLYGGLSGLTTATSQTYRPGSGGVPSSGANTIYKFGEDMSVSRLDGDDFDDLIVGAPSSGYGRGDVMFLLGGGGGLAPSSTKWTQGFAQGSVVIPGKPEAVIMDPSDPRPYLGIGLGDEFGTAVGGTADGIVAVGAPREGHTQNDVDHADAAGNDWSEWEGWLLLATTDPSTTGDVVLQKARARTQDNMASRVGELGFLGRALTKPRLVSRYLEPDRGANISGFFVTDASEGTGGAGTAPALAHFDQSTAPWTSTDAVITRNGAVFSEGGSSLEISSSGTVISPAFDTSAWEPIGTKLVFDLLVQRPMSPSHLALYLDVPAAGIAPILLVELDLDDLATDRWTPIGVTLSDAARSAFLGHYVDSHLRFVVSMPSGGKVFIDDMRMLGNFETRSSWPMFGLGPQRVALSRTPGPHAATVRWSADLHGDVRSSPVIAADGTVYVGSDDSHVYALKPDGSQKWSFNTGGLVRATPALDDHNRLFVGSGDRKFYALDATTGTMLWSFTTGGTITSSALVDANDIVYFGSNDDWVYALDGRNGALLWKYKTLADIDSSPALGPNGILYVGSDDNRLYALRIAPNLSASQRLLWVTNLGGDIESAPVIGPGPDYPIYVGSEANKLFKVNGSTGAIIWTYTGNLFLDVDTTPTITPDGTIVFGTDSNRVIGLNPNGSTRFTFTTGGDVNSSPVATPDGIVYVGSDDNYLYALRTEPGLTDAQRQVFRLNLGNDVRSSAAIAADGTLYIGSDHNRLYAVHE